MATINDLKSWVTSGKFASWDTDVYVKHSTANDESTEIQFSILTETNEYTITAVEPRPSGEIIPGNYLGCTSLSRTCRPGESWKRGNDLSDGPFTYDTWTKIMSDIISCEMQKIT